MKTLQSRKTLLIAESEMNRAHVIADFKVLKADVGTFCGSAQKVVKGVSTAAMILAGFSVFLRRKSLQPQVKRSWLQTAVKGAGFIFTIWRTIRTNPGQRKF